MNEIETNKLSHVCGGAGRPTPAPSPSAAPHTTPTGSTGSAAALNPFTYWTNVWTNAMTAPLTFAPPFSTTPLFPTPFY